MKHDNNNPAFFDDEMSGNREAVLSAGLGFLGLAMFGAFPSLLGAVFGVLAKRKGDRTAMPIFGIASGVIGIGLSLFRMKHK